MFQIEQFEVLNSLRDELINALNRENNELKDAAGVRQSEESLVVNKIG